MSIVRDDSRKSVAKRASDNMTGMIGRLHHVVLDCPDPAALASFYSRLLGDPITYVSEDWVVVSTSSQASGLAFQLAPDHQSPTWPNPRVPQQLHLDVMVEDITAATEQVLELGAIKLDGEDVFADPAGHPFCLVRRPGWAAPIPTDLPGDA
jgi:catechol 2,3-dioxygenase-like lactoylglutathione lyase family enzyme